MKLFLETTYKLLFILTIGSIPFGVFSMLNSYYVSTTNFCIDPTQLKKLGPHEIDRELVQLFPEYFSRKKEDRWWNRQKRLYEFLKANKTAPGVIRKDGQEFNVLLFINSIDPKTIFNKTGLIYLSMAIYLMSAIFVRGKHSNYSFGLPAAIFLLSATLYLSTSAPLAGRQLTLNPLHFKILVLLNYVAGGLVISIVHFAFLFPKPKRLIVNHPYLAWIPYTYVFIVTVLYFLKITAFDTSLPFFFFWAAILVWAFWDSLTREQDPLIRKQIYLVLFAPLFLSVIFVFLHVVPLASGMEALDFSTFAIMSLIVPFALPLALDNVALQTDKSKIEQLLQEELDDVRKTLHDFILRKFSFITVYSQNLIRESEKLGEHKILNGLKEIKKEAGHVSHDLRFFLNLLNTECETWNDYLAKLRYYSRKLLEPSGIAVEVSASNDLLKQAISPLKVQSELFWIISEGLANIIIHSGATKVQVLFSNDDHNLIVKIVDNGKGLSRSDLKRSHLGFQNILKHASSIGGTVKIFTKKRMGTAIQIRIPKQKYHTTI